MAILKNVASQKLSVLAVNTLTGDPVTGDAANITAEISLDGGTSAATNDVNPTELDATDHPGVYIFDLTQAETNADLIIVSAVSTTTYVRLESEHRHTDPETKDANMVQISGDSTAADNLEATYDGTGYTDDFAPATQAQVGSLAVGAGGISTVATSYTLTTGTQSAGTYASTEELDGTVHTIDTPAANLDFYYEFNVGVNGIATEILWDGYVGNNGDQAEVYGWDWVSSSWKQIGAISGKNANTVEEHVFLVTNNMTGTGANAGTVRFRLESSGADVAVDINTDRVWCEYTSTASEALILHSGIAQGGASNSITLDSGANANDSFYSNTRVVITSGTGKEQERVIVDYNGTTKVATVSPPWTTNPDSTSAFDVEAASGHCATDHQTVRVATAQAGGAASITLDANASATNDFYKGDAVELHAGTGAGQSRIITAYNGTTKVATVSRAWIVNPDSTTEFFIQEASVDVDAVGGESATATAAVDFDDLATIEAWTASNADIPGAVWDEVITKAAHNVSNSAAKYLRLLKQGSTTTESAVNDPGAAATTTVFNTDLTEVDNFWNDMTLVFTTGSLAGQGKPIKSFANTNGQITLDEALTSAPADNDEFVITSCHVHPISDIAAAILSDGVALNTTAGVLDVVNLTNTTTTNTDMRGTDSALLAASAPTNWSSMVVSAGGAVDSLLQGFLNNTIAETTADNIAANFEVFFDNANVAPTTQTVDDVGSGGTVDANVIQVNGNPVTLADLNFYISLFTPVKGQLLTINAGDDYESANGTEISFTDTGFPTLTDVLDTAATLTIRDERNGNLVIDHIASYDVDNGTKTIKFEMTSAQSTLSIHDDYRYDVEVTFTATSGKKTVMKGPAKVTDGLS